MVWLVNWNQRCQLIKWNTNIISYVPNNTLKRQQKQKVKRLQLTDKENVINENKNLIIFFTLIKDSDQNCVNDQNYVDYQSQADNFCVLLSDDCLTSIILIFSESFISLLDITNHNNWIFSIKVITVITIIEKLISKAKLLIFKLQKKRWKT